MGNCLCDHCAGLCCRYFALPIDNPSNKRDYDNIRWYLLHENVTVFVEKKQWYIGVANRCKALQLDNRCGIYHTRPKVCRGYSTDNCDWHGGQYNFESLFTSAEQLQTYATAKLKEDRARERARKARAITRKGHKTASVSAAKRRAVSGPTVKRPRKDLKRLSQALTRHVAQQPAAVSGNGRGIALPLLKR